MYTPRLHRIIFFIFVSFSITFAQNPVLDNTNVDQLRELSERLKKRHASEKALALQKAAEMGWPVRQELGKGQAIELMALDESGHPIYFTTDNMDAAATVSTNTIWPSGSAGLNLDGSGMTAGVWDADAVRSTHQELSGRVTQADGETALHDHSTHVAGTIIASGVQNSAHGMAANAQIDAYDWDDDEAEMATAAADGLLLSNHSYGIGVGWYLFLGFIWQWAGDEGISEVEDYKFGYYNQEHSQTWDQIAYDAPYYLICKSAGNDRGSGQTGSNHELDGGENGYDCIGPQGVAKNILTVGAVNDIPAGYSQVSDVVMSSFSSWGPTDDGRIKPDLVANGVGVYSPISTGNSSYDTYDGTSMATPNATGSLLLLQQQYHLSSGGSYMRSATLKGLAIHTADEAGSADGPDYIYGWGLLNTERAALLIDQVWKDQKEHTIKESSLNQGGVFSMQVTADGTQPLRATICWTDPPGTPAAASLDPADIMLVNDLDLRITGNSTTHFPWCFASPNPNTPSTTATTGDNIRDNVEQVLVSSPSPTTYTITVSHKGSLQSGSQPFSLIMSGAHYSDQSLPVNLTSLEAIPGVNEVTLEWETQSETNNLGFQLLRSRTIEGNYNLIASYKEDKLLEGLGNSSFGQNYSYTDSEVEENRLYWYKIQDVDINGNSTTHGPISARTLSSGRLMRETDQLPLSFNLGQNYPNPFNPVTRFKISLPQTANINVEIYDYNGRKVISLFKGRVEAGNYFLHWAGMNDLGEQAASGVYIYSLKADNFFQARRMLLLK